jgi:hypothetical protein
MDKQFDRYDWQARIYPAILVLLPLGLFLLVWMFNLGEVPKAQDLVKLVPGSAIGACMLLFLAQLARSYGKKREQRLINDWGGWPTTLALRHRDATIDPVTKRRYHEALARLVPNVAVPTAADEAADPQGADTVYGSCVKYVKAQTRDAKEYSLLLTENIDYGFRRNLLGLKQLGKICSLAGVIGCLWRLIREVQHHGQTVPLTFLCLFVCLLLVYFWSVRINAAWVRQAADAYAARLLETLDRRAVASTASVDAQAPAERSGQADG